MMPKKKHYDEDFKRKLVSLCREGRSKSSVAEEYGISRSALREWIMQYSTIELGKGEELTVRQIKELQRRCARLEEENNILKKANAIFMPH